MICKGIVKGNIIELEKPLPYPEGQAVDVAVQPVPQPEGPGSPACVLQAMDELEPLEKCDDDETAGSPALLLKIMREPPHVDPSIVDELERAIAEAKLPVRYEGIFDSEADQ